VNLLHRQIIERYPDPLFVSPHDLAGSRGVIGVNHQHETFRDADRTGYLQARPALFQRLSPALRDAEGLSSRRGRCGGRIGLRIPRWVEEIARASARSALT
jgi:hypothetical protein